MLVKEGFVSQGNHGYCYCKINIGQGRKSCKTKRVSSVQIIMVIFSVR